MKYSHTKVVLFIDLLGFASLTERNPLDVESINQSERPLSPLSWTLEHILSSSKNPLTRAFISFHRALKSAIDLAQMKHPVTAITFSDSAFIATNQLFEAVHIGVSIIQTLLHDGIPIRAGIAYGSFAAIRFRSDVTSFGGVHAAHFLGTGVVLSHATETCGIKGIRLLVHPSAFSLLPDAKHNPKYPENDTIRCIKCSEQERINDEDVQYEVDYWHLKTTAEKETWHAFQDMWSAAPNFALIHYQATADAINRMRIQQGQPGLKNLRRRTLPHRVHHES